MGTIYHLEIDEVYKHSKLYKQSLQCHQSPNIWIALE